MSSIQYIADTTDPAGHSQKLETLFRRLNVAGLPVSTTRLDRYKKSFATIDKYVRENRLKELSGRVPFPTIVNDFHESQEILEACDQFDDLNQPGLRERLEKILSGVSELHRERSSEPRNILFELVMAAMLKREGFEIHLDRIEDVSFDFFGRPWFIECKRIRSKRKLRERINEAALQIGKRCDNSQNSEAKGIIALDVSKLLNDGTRIFRCATLYSLKLEAERLLEAFRDLQKSTLESVKESRVLGVYLYSRMPGTIEQPVGLWTVKEAIFIILHIEKTKEHALARKFVDQITSS
jgi:hypothetical protein